MNRFFGALSTVDPWQGRRILKKRHGGMTRKMIYAE